MRKNHECMKKKIVCVFSVLCILAFCVAGCTKKMEVQSLLIDGEYVPVDTLLKIDSREISLFEYRYYYSMIKTDMDLGDEQYWEKNEGSLEELKKTVLEHIQYAYAKYELADALGIELKKENRNNVNSLLKEYKAASGSNQAFENDLKDAMLDEALFRKLLESDELSSMIYDYYFGDNGVNQLSTSDIQNYVYENYIHYKQIYVRFDYDGTQTNKQLMDSIIEQLDNGGDFTTLMKKYSRDPNVSSYPNGYYAVKNYDSDLVKHLSALEEGTYSGVITGTSGYYIYLRLGFDDDVLKNIDTFREEMENNFLDDLLQEYIDKQNIEIVSEYYDDISFETLLY